MSGVKRGHVDFRREARQLLERQIVAAELAESAVAEAHGSLTAASAAVKALRPDQRQAIAPELKELKELHDQLSEIVAALESVVSQLNALRAKDPLSARPDVERLGAELQTVIGRLEPTRAALDATVDGLHGRLPEAMREQDLALVEDQRVRNGLRALARGLQLRSDPKRLGSLALVSASARELERRVGARLRDRRPIDEAELEALRGDADALVEKGRARLRARRERDAVVVTLHSALKEGGFERTESKEVGDEAQTRRMRHKADETVVVSDVPTEGPVRFEMYGPEEGASCTLGPDELCDENVGELMRHLWDMGIRLTALEQDGPNGFTPMAVSAPQEEEVEGAVHDDDEEARVAYLDGGER